MVNSEQLVIFPFGQPVRRVVQQDKSHKLVFILCVYASAVHALQTGNDGKKKMNALCVASEPCIFRRVDDPESIIKQIEIPKEMVG